eukprot:CAMPEP_0179997520 /NCGR_PEP_ID=MMETSP0984-20121128/8178_1 /TAXON_ID=483367 /ORGANISM="non described non described, Strain CCMP 2436" /LENGTH=134 /DNA_ID=CAMNT_0021917115 /DNA_START=32 /DNA_END=433 /DNA_ORIENTATION=+
MCVPAGGTRLRPAASPPCLAGLALGRSQPAGGTGRVLSVGIEEALAARAVHRASSATVLLRRAGKPVRVLAHLRDLRVHLDPHALAQGAERRHRTRHGPQRRRRRRGSCSPQRGSRAARRDAILFLADGQVAVR